ncbi:hypothetical protein G6F68_020179 [Rhizopus microsporus]|nr:hypothetical protein G6F68_020179 [Rhizopus microsporus]
MDETARFIIEADALGRANAFTDAEAMEAGRFFCFLAEALDEAARLFLLETTDILEAEAMEEIARLFFLVAAETFVEALRTAEAWRTETLEIAEAI